MRQMCPWTALLCSLALFFACSSSAPAAEGTGAIPRDQIKAIVEKEYPNLADLYQSIHSHPELSRAEEQTAKKLAEELRAAGYKVTEHVGGHGVVAVMENGVGKTLLVRTDLDALPVKEETGAAYASKVEATDPTGKSVGVMHACGHDVHIASLVGTARAMAALKDKWHGTLVLIGQPAEEAVSGAKAMLADGLFTRFPRPDWCLALHVESDLENGKVGFTPGFALANVDSVDILVRGVGSHGSAPEKGKDPIVIAAQIITALQTIASRETAPTEAVVVTVGTIHGGTRRNIIPDEVALQLTVRTYKDDVRKHTLESIDRISKGIAMAAGVPKDREPVITLILTEATSATYNTPVLVQRTTGVFRELLGPDNVIERKPVMGAEDFGLFGREEPKIPIFMYRLGTISPEKIAESQRTGVPLPNLHTARYLPEPTSIKTGVLTMTAAAIDLLK